MQSIGLQRVRHDCLTGHTCLDTCICITESLSVPLKLTPRCHTPISNKSAPFCNSPHCLGSSLYLITCILHSVQFSSVAQSCPTLCDPMNCGTPGLPVHHQLPEFTRTHVHRVSDAIQSSHPLSSPSPPTPNPSQHQSFFQ